MNEWPVGTNVDLYDSSFQQWRGEYVVIKAPAEPDWLYKLRNTKTGSQQFVSGSRLRRGRLGPFRIDILYEEK